MIQVKNLTRQFDKRGIAGLNGLSFDMTKGEVMAIIGPNGSGKSTLLKILSSQIPHESGTFKIDGSVTHFPSFEIVEDLNVQKFLVSSVTLDIDEEKKIQLARDLADTFEFTFQLRQNLSELSSGQKQKILLSRELINRPALLLMDEPFTHLDPFTRKDILRGLFSYIRSQEITVLWVTHDLEEALRFSDRIALLNFGKLEQVDTPTFINQKPRNLFVAQFMGYRNFLPVTKNNSEWESMFGKVPLTGPEQADAILVIPDDAWTLDENGLKWDITQAYPTRQGMEYALSREERNLFVKLPTQAKLHKKALTLTPEWVKCFLIQL